MKYDIIICCKYQDILKVYKMYCFYRNHTYIYIYSLISRKLVHVIKGSA